MLIEIGIEIAIEIGAIGDSFDIGPDPDPDPDPDFDFDFDFELFRGDYDYDNDNDNDNEETVSNCVRCCTSASPLAPRHSTLETSSTN